MVVERQSLFKKRNILIDEEIRLVSFTINWYSVAGLDLVMGFLIRQPAQYFAFGSELKMKCLSSSKLKASGKQSSSGFPQPEPSCSKRIVFLLIPTVHSLTEGQL